LADGKVQVGFYKDNQFVSENINITEWNQ
jgi:hypothetical protein